jgi:hypothetical protein
MGSTRPLFEPVITTAFALLACAPKYQAPPPPAPRLATTVRASQPKTWDAVIDVFAERNIPIRTMERASGFIATDQLGVSNSEGGEWADCGKLKWPKQGKEKKATSTRLSPNRATYNVLIRGDTVSSTVKVTARWVHISERGAMIECMSNGSWEQALEREIVGKAETK